MNRPEQSFSVCRKACPERVRPGGRVEGGPGHAHPFIEKPGYPLPAPGCHRRV